MSTLHYVGSLLQRGFAADAAEVLEQIEEDPLRQLTSREQRFLGLIYLVLDDIEEGVAHMAEAYRRDSELIVNELDAMMLPGTDQALRQLVRRAVNHANESPSAESWFVVAVLAQAQDRNHVARRMLQRVEQLGPDGLPADLMQAELSPR